MKKVLAEQDIGKKYHKLVVEKIVAPLVSKNGRKFTMVECLCDCGNRKTIRLNDIRCGKTKTCGFNHPHYEDRSMPAFKNLYNHAYKAGALKRGLIFTLTEEEFREITQQSCHYCGIQAGESNRYNRYGTYKTKTGKIVSEYRYNGIDRKDNSKGYTLENVVPCCGVCNHAKHTMSYEDFNVWLDQLVLFRTHTIPRKLKCVAIS